MNILLVEDSLTLQLQISNDVKSAGHAITVANNGETAVQLMELSGGSPKMILF
jgi:CheY-like chemotaxis protein